MKKLEKLFGGYPMSWKRVVIFAVITAVYTALINEIGFLKNTSFQDIAVNLECWIVFAIFIAVNCEKWWESALKCFVFFLISQPLIYLIEVPFEELGWGIFGYYRHWFIITLLTLPGGAVAFFLKKRNLLSAAILSVAVGYFAYASVLYFQSARWSFPRHIISAAACLVFAVVLVKLLLDRQSHRTAVRCVIAAVFIFFALHLEVFSAAQTYDIWLDSDSEFTYTVDDPSIVDVSVNGGVVSMKARRNGNAVISLEDADGDVTVCNVTSNMGKLLLDFPELELVTDE